MMQTIHPATYSFIKYPEERGSKLIRHFGNKLQSSLLKKYFTAKLKTYCRVNEEINYKNSFSSPVSFLKHRIFLSVETDISTQERRNHTLVITERFSPN
jgi:hypothetical protein